jgi:hypothetical protein
MIAAVVAVDPRARRVDVSGGVAVELRGGVAPRTFVDPPEPTLLMIVSPNADLEVRHRRSGTFNLGITPRVQYRTPNRLSVERPIVLAQMYATHEADITRTWRSRWDLGASVGELDYTGVIFALGDGQATTFDVDVAQFAFASAQAELAGRVAPKHTILLAPRFELRAPIGRTADAARDGLSLLPTQLFGTVALGHRIQVTDIDAVETTVRPGLVDYNGEVTFFSGDGRVGWQRRFRPALRGQADVGVFGARTLRTTDDAATQAGEVKVFPVGGLQLIGRLYGRSTHEVEGNLGAGVVGFFDRVTERVEPRANVTAGITTFVPPKWRIGISAMGFTPVTREPVPLIGAMMQRIPETVVTATTPVTYTIDDHAQFEFGTVFSVRGSHFADPDFEFTQLEAWLYVAFRFAGGTSHGGEVAGARRGPIGVGAQGFGAITSGR